MTPACISCDPCTVYYPYHRFVSTTNINEISRAEELMNPQWIQKRRNAIFASASSICGSEEELETCEGEGVKMRDTTTLPGNGRALSCSDLVFELSDRKKSVSVCTSATLDNPLQLRLHTGYSHLNSFCPSIPHNSIRPINC